MAVAYEAGPTGFGLARALTAAGIRCEVAAPSKLQRPVGDRVKTDARDALHLARLLRLDEVTCGARCRPCEQEAARDLVRAREDCRGDLMRARHRLSKLLLRHGIVYSGGQAWTGAARCVAAPAASSTRRPLRLAFEADYEAVLTVEARRDRLDAAIEEMAADSEFTPVVRRLCCLRGISTLTGFALAVEIGDWDRFTGATIGAFLGLVPSEYSSGAVPGAGLDHQDRQRPRPPAAGRGGLAPPQARTAVRARRCGPGGSWPRRRPGPAAMQGNRRLHHRWVGSPTGASGPWSPTSRSPASWPAGAGRWPSWTTDHPEYRFLDPRRLVAARGATRGTTMSSHPFGPATPDPRHADPFPPNTRPAVPNPRISV